MASEQEVTTLDDTDGLNNDMRHGCYCARPHLPRRHLDVLEAIANRMTTHEAALTPNISPATVDSHIAHMMAMIGVTRRKELIDVTLEQGILSTRFPRNRTGRACPQMATREPWWGNWAGDWRVSRP